MSVAERDAAWHEREYNPRLTVAETADILDEWPRRAAATRARRPMLADIRTGDHPREVLDLFRPAAPKGTLVFIHGGYWRAFSKVETSWIAEGFVDQAFSVALINYPLCPDVSLETLIESVRRSFAKLFAEILDEAERAAIVVSGHSAGGHLTAALMATDWTTYGLPARPFHGAVPISGIFELAPLIPTSMNDAIRLDQDSAAHLSLVGVPPRVAVPMVLAVGEKESAEFHRQSEALAKAWTSLEPRVVDIPGANHFTVLDGLAEPGGVLNAIVVDMLSSARGRAPT